FQGLRSDKPAKSIIRETSMPAASTKKTRSAKAADAISLDKLKVTNPERIIDESTKTKKIDVVRYYGLVGALMLEHLHGRPVSLVRAPDGVKGSMFFQKHLETSKMTGVKQLSKNLDPDH